MLHTAEPNFWGGFRTAFGASGYGKLRGVVGGRWFVEWWIPTVNCAHNKSIEHEGNTSVHTPWMACEMSRTRMCVDIVSGRCHNLKRSMLIIMQCSLPEESTTPQTTCLPLPEATFLEQPSYYPIIINIYIICRW